MDHSSTWHLITGSAAETHDLGLRLGRLLSPGDVVALSGQLGAGKTCLAQGIARGLGVDGAVTSPTFIIVSEYRAAKGITLSHIDCYRFQEQGTAEALAVGLDELMASDAVCIVEWGERIAGLLPSEHLQVVLAYAGHTVRRIDITARGQRYSELLEMLKDGHPQTGVSSGRSTMRPGEAASPRADLPELGA